MLIYKVWQIVHLSMQETGSVSQLHIINKLVCGQVHNTYDKAEVFSVICSCKVLKAQDMELANQKIASSVSKYHLFNKRDIAFPHEPVNHHERLQCSLQSQKPSQVIVHIGILRSS